MLGIHYGGKKISPIFNLGTFIKNPINSFFDKYNNTSENKNLNEKQREYFKKINYKFIQNPLQLKYKDTLIKTNDIWGANDLFEIFISYRDNKEYIVSPNNHNYNLDILSLLDNSLIISLKGHNKNITTIRYFINNKDNNEYFISADKFKIVIIWDIANNYNIKYKINTNYIYKGDIYICLLVFLDNIKDEYIITSTRSVSEDNNSATKIYSFINGEYINYIKDSSINPINYLLSWFNKNNNKYYIIQLSKGKILINNFLKDELYCELKQEPEGHHYGALILNKNNKDYLLASSDKGNINVLDLSNKKIFKIINVNSILIYIIEWNKYIIAGDYTNKSFKIIDIENNEVIANIGGKHSRPVTCIKKVNHPIYGESLLTASWDKTIKLWSI